MKNVSAGKQIATSLPKLATMAFVFWGLSSSSHLDAAPAWTAQLDLPSHVAPAKGSLEASIGVLSNRDAALYRASFAAQEKADWHFAEQALAQVKDKRLTGHILADRYLRRGMTLAEAKEWFAAYSDLPEAPELYAAAKNIRGFKSASIKKPQSVAWQGINGFSSPTVFRSTNDNEQNALKRGLAAKVNTALRSGAPQKAADALNTALGRGELPIAQAGDFSSRTAAALFYNGETESARKMAHAAAEAGIPLGYWIEGLAAWKQRDFGSAARSFAKLAALPDLTSWNKASASYWAYRANSRLGDKNQAYKWLAEAANHPHTFYGAMASRLMGHKIERSWKMPELNQAAIDQLSSKPEGWRALALAQVGRIDLAENSVRRVLSSNGREMQAAALALAEKANMPSLILSLSGVTMAGNGKPFDAALYPLPPWQPRGGFKVDRALIYAIMRHESQFDPDAVSSRGACGLMQLMPATARHIESENYIRRPANSNCAHRLLDPATNVDMGQKYVRTLAETSMIGDNLLYLLAAYNGGPGNLQRWLGNSDKSDPLLFVESLPIRETRDYVQQVLLHYSMYRSRLSQSETAVLQLAHGEWPRVAVNDTQTANAGIAEFASIQPGTLNGTR
jgi:soluble lytic murein transglycosylase